MKGGCQLDEQPTSTTASFYIHLDKSSKLESAKVIDRIWDEGTSDKNGENNDD